MRYLLRVIARCAALVLFAGIVLALTPLPFQFVRTLSHAPCDTPPDAIVLMSGAGMPTADGFIKAYYTALEARVFAKAVVMVAMPASESTDSSDAWLSMRSELVMRGVEEGRIHLAPLGINTRTQALDVIRRLEEMGLRHIRIVSSPIHIRRAVSTFAKAGTGSVCGIAAWDIPLNEQDLEGKDGGPAGALSVRYNVWTQLQFEVLLVREWLALGYYWFRDWI